MTRTIPLDILESVVDLSSNLNILEAFPNDDDRYQYLVNQFIKRPHDVIKYVLSNRRFELFRKLDKEFELARVELHKTVLKCRSVDVLEVWTSCGLQFPHNIADISPKYDSIDVVDWLLKRGYEVDKERIIFTAAQSGSIDMVKWVMNRLKISPDLQLISGAYNKLRYQLLQWIHQRYDLCPPIGVEYASKWRKYWLLFTQCGGTPYALLHELRKGNIEEVKEFYIMFAGRLDEWVSKEIMKRGIGELVHWFIEDYPEITKSNYGGRYQQRVYCIREDVRQLFLRAIGYTTDLQLVDYLIGKRRPDLDIIEDMYYTAACNDNIVLIEHLISLPMVGPPRRWPHTETLMVNACYEVVQWLHTRFRLRLTSKCVDDLVHLDVQFDNNPKKRLQLIRWICDRGIECYERQAKTALWFGHYSIVLWMCETFEFEIHPALKELLESDQVESGMKFKSLTHPFDIDELVREGRLITLRWLKEHHPELLRRPSDGAREYAQCCGYQRTVEFINEHFQLS